MADRSVCVRKDEVLNILDEELNFLYSQDMTTPEYANSNFGAIAAINRIGNAVRELDEYRAPIQIPPMSDNQKNRLRLKMYKGQRDIHERKIAESMARIELLNKQIDILEKMEEKHENKD